MCKQRVPVQRCKAAMTNSIGSRDPTRSALGPQYLERRSNQGR
jgi:hypothetical protein